MHIRGKTMKISKFLLVGLFSGLLLASCGGSGDSSSTPSGTTSPTTTTTTSQESWTLMTADEFSAAFTAAQDAPWNHYEGTYGGGLYERDESGNPILGAIAANYNGANWVVDTARSKEGAPEISDLLILTQYQLEEYLNPPEGATVTFKKKGNKYQMIIHMETSGSIYDAFSELDEYFYATDSIVRSNANMDHLYRIENEAHVTWSTLAV